MDKIFSFVDDNIGNFHRSKLDAIKELKLGILLKRKNPYLFKAKNVTTAEEFVRNLQYSSAKRLLQVIKHQRKE
jgi:hypothetical protein